MIKLYKVDEMSDGTERFSTQLGLRNNTISFIREKNGVMKHFNRGEKGIGFYEYKKPFKIVENISDMRKQILD
jgi:hypothetical protein